MLRTAACLLCFACLAVPARSQPAPLRSLVYDVQLDVRVVDREDTAGINHGGAPRRRAASVGLQSSGNLQHPVDVSDSGRLRIDVVAATGDGGLVVDAAFAGARAAQRPLRVAITSDGRLGFDPSQELSVAAARLLPLLARGFLADKDVGVGLGWESRAGRSVSRYHVADKDADRVTLRVVSDIAPGAAAAEHDDAVLLYDARAACPVRYTLNARIDRHRGPGDDETIVQTLTAVLRADSFAKT